MNRYERVALRDRERRDRTQRFSGIHEMDQAQVRKDLGFKLTNEQYAAYLKDSADYKKNSATAGKEIGAAKSKIDAALKELKPMSVEDHWQKYQSSWDVDVRVVSEDNRIEKVYKLPKAVVKELEGKLTEGGQGTHWGAWVGDTGKHYNISTKVRGGKMRGKELHETLGKLPDQIKQEYIKAGAGNIQKAEAIKDKERGKVQGALVEVSDAEQSWAMGAAERDQQISGRKSRYQQSRKDRYTALAGLT